MNSLSPSPQKTELLAPAGSPEALIAAVRCGADAVYLGAGSFHARQNAQGFDDAALQDAVSYCHARGVAVHLTLNTLVREDELPAALEEAARAARLGVDALIVQDRGLARAIHRCAPEMPLHASTQLSCHTPDGVRQLQADGFSRVVLAREMTSEEIAACCATGCEIEVFVHGALCMCVSGQCFLSAMLGGRSGNRGRCAQPCRLPFSTEAHPKEDDRALSLKDLSLCAHLPALVKAGACSFKIEGRMKRPEYVAAATAVCRAALDGVPIDPVLENDLRAVFSRSGFTDGYYVGKRDKTMFGSRTKEDVTAAASALKRLQRLYEKESPRVPLAMALTVRCAQPICLQVSDNSGHTLKAEGETARDADGKTISAERLATQLQKLGGTPFFLPPSACEVSVEEGADLPLSAVNALRREAVERLLRLRAAASPIPFTKTDAPLPPTEVPPVPALVVRLAKAAQFSTALSQTAALVTLPLSSSVQELRRIAAVMPVAVEIPRALFSREDAVRRALREAKQAGAVAAVCGNSGAIPLCRDASLPAIGGFALHAFNSEALAAYREDGLVAATLSMELSLRQMAFAARAPLAVGGFVYGRQPLMLLRNCPQRAKKGCGGCDGRRTLTDRKGVSFLLACTDGCPDLLNSVPLYLADRAEKLPRLSFWTLYMTDESAARVCALAQVYAAAANGEPVPAAERLLGKGGFTRGLALKGVE